jgi:hypothetical protein
MSEKKEIRSPIKAIRAYCMDCSNGQYSEVKKCPCTKCPLFAFRFGMNPFWGKGAEGAEGSKTGGNQGVYSNTTEKLTPSTSEPEKVQETPSRGRPRCGDCPRMRVNSFGRYYCREGNETILVEPNALCCRAPWVVAPKNLS